MGWFEWLEYRKRKRRRNKRRAAQPPLGRLSPSGPAPLSSLLSLSGPLSPLPLSPHGPPEAQHPFSFLSPAWAAPAHSLPTPELSSAQQPARSASPPARHSLLPLFDRRAPRVNAFFSLPSFFPGAQRPEIPGDLPSSGPHANVTSAAHKRRTPASWYPEP
jgi:hypothetical protein